VKLTDTPHVTSGSGNGQPFSGKNFGCPAFSLVLQSQRDWIMQRIAMLEKKIAQPFIRFLGEAVD
jgi:hypothetical protein